MKNMTYFLGVACDPDMFLRDSPENIICKTAFYSETPNMGTNKNWTVSYGVTQQKYRKKQQLNIQIS